MNKTITPELAEVIRDATGKSLLAMRVEVPAHVTAFNADEQTVDVKPLIRDLVQEDGERVAKPIDVIPRVPIAYMRWGGFVLRCDIAVGDIVSLRFADRDLYPWLSGDGSEATPQSRRAHALDDAVAVPGPSVWGRAIAGLGDGALVLGREDGEGEVRINADGTITIGRASGPHQRAAREGDATIVDPTSDAAFIQYLVALHGAVVSVAGGLGTTPAVAAFATANPAPPTTITGRINAGSDRVGVG